MTFELGKLHIKRNITSIILQNSNTKSVGYGVQNSFCARGNNNYDVSMLKTGESLGDKRFSVEDIIC